MQYHKKDRCVIPWVILTNKIKMHKSYLLPIPYQISNSPGLQTTELCNNMNILDFLITTVSRMVNVNHLNFREISIIWNDCNMMTAWINCYK